MSSTASSAAASASPTAAAIAGDRVSDVALGDEPVVVRLGGGVQEHHAVVGDAGRRGPSRTSRAARAAPWSTSMFAHMRFAYGNTTMRLSGETVRISSGENAVCDHASGFAGGDRRERRPQLADVTSGARRSSRPASARSAVSNSGYTIVGAIAPCAHLVVAAARAGVADHPRSTARRRPTPNAARRAARAAPASRVYMLSAPPMSTTSHSPRWMRSANSLTSSCGLLPPTVDTAVARGAIPSRRARSAPGIGVRPRHDLHDGDDVDACRAASAPASVSAARAASSNSSIGDSRSSAGTRCDVCPTPTMTGLRGCHERAEASGRVAAWARVASGSAHCLRSWTSPSTGKISTDSIAAPTSAAASADDTRPVCRPISVDHDDERQRGRLQEHERRRSARAAADPVHEQRRRAAHDEQQQRQVERDVAASCRRRR